MKIWDSVYIFFICVLFRFPFLYSCYVFRQRAGQVDSVIVPAVRNFLFKPKNEFFGGDLGKCLCTIAFSSCKLPLV